MVGIEKEREKTHLRRYTRREREREIHLLCIINKIIF